MTEKLKNISIGNWITIGLMLVQLAGTIYVANFKINLNTKAIAAHAKTTHLSKADIELMIIDRFDKLIERIREPK